MKMPQMILFDYGQTLVAEQKFDGVRGTEAVLRYAVKNRYHLSAEQVQANAAEINEELGRFDPKKRHLFQIEIPNTMFTPYLYESLGIEVSLSNPEIDRVFWDAAAPGIPTEGIEDFLKYLKYKGIRTGVISNIAYAPSVVAERINKLLPENSFEFIITSSNYVFRKPNKRIFDLALEKARLRPSEVWYAGDQYECDIKGALHAGLLPVWYQGAIDIPYTMEEWLSMEKECSVEEESSIKGEISIEEGLSKEETVMEKKDFVEKETSMEQEPSTGKIILTVTDWSELKRRMEE